jgi:hypothetical protein
MQTDAPSRRGGVTERQLRYWRIATRVIDALMALALAVVAALVLKMIFF